MLESDAQSVPSTSVPLNHCHRRRTGNLSSSFFPCAPTLNLSLCLFLSLYISPLPHPLANTSASGCGTGLRFLSAGVYRNGHCWRGLWVRTPLSTFPPPAGFLSPARSPASCVRRCFFSSCASWTFSVCPCGALTKISSVFCLSSNLRKTLPRSGNAQASFHARLSWTVSFCQKILNPTRSLKNCCRLMRSNFWTLICRGGVSWTCGDSCEEGCQNLWRTTRHCLCRCQCHCHWSWTDV